MNVLIVGYKGFIGKNLFYHLKENKKFNILLLDKHSSQVEIEDKVCKAELIFLIFGINKEKLPGYRFKDNYLFTEKICCILKKNNKKTNIIFTSSIQANQNTSYGKSKIKAERILLQYKKETKSKVLIYRLPNIFGKWSKPHYNSAVATFCYQVARKKKISLFNKRSKITLLYIDDLIKQFLRKINKKNEKKTFPLVENTYRISVLELSNLIKSFNKKNKINLINNLKNPFVKKLYSTYVSFLPQKDFIYKIKKNVDHRGEFTEFLNNDNFGQFSCFSILPGKIRGNHYHHTKLEKFLVLNGKVKFKFIDLSSNLKFSFAVKYNKKRSIVVNTIPGWAHNIKNIGTDTAKLVVWSNEIFDKNNTDTFNYKL